MDRVLFLKTTKKGKWCEVLTRGFPNWRTWHCGFYESAFHTRGMKKDGVPVDSVLSHEEDNIDSVRLLLEKTRMLPNSHVCCFFFLKICNSGNTLNKLRGQLMFCVRFSGIIKNTTFHTKWHYYWDHRVKILRLLITGSTFSQLNKCHPEQCAVLLILSLVTEWS